MGINSKMQYWCKGNFTYPVQFRYPLILHTLFKRKSKTYDEITDNR